MSNCDRRRSSSREPRGSHCTSRRVGVIPAGEDAEAARSVDSEAKEAAATTADETASGNSGSRRDGLLPRCSHRRLLVVSFSAKREPPAVAVFFSDASSVVLAREQLGRNPNPYHSLHDLSLEREVSGPVSVVVVVAGARCEDTARLQELARNVSPRPIVVLNPEWTPEDESDPTWGAFLKSFETAYAFLPLAIQGFLSKTEGAVLKNVQSGAPGGRPWLIFVKEDGKYTRLASLQRRPGPADLESALYNAMAANSPVTKSIKFFRGLVSKE